MLELMAVGNITTEYPLSQLTICVGFFFVYFLEELSHWLITKLPNEPCSSHLKKISPSVTPLDTTETKNSTTFIINDQYQKEKKEETKSVREMKDDMLSIDENHENMVYDSLSLDSEVGNENEKNNQLTKEAEKHAEYEIKTQQQLMRWVFVVVALSMHAIFEGLTIGLQNSKADIWYLFIAVSIHSATILFCMGLELLMAKTRNRYIFVQMFILAMASPCGIILGLLLTLKSNMETKARSTAIVLLEGFSAGAILYITFFEVLNREKERRVYRLYRALCIIGGFSLMAFLQYLEMHHQ